MEATKDHITEEERALLALFRELDGKGRHHLFLAARSIKTTAEQRRERFTLSIN